MIVVKDVVPRIREDVRIDSTEGEEFSTLVANSVEGLISARGTDGKIPLTVYFRQWEYPVQ